MGTILFTRSVQTAGWRSDTHLFHIQEIQQQRIHENHVACYSNITVLLH